MCEDREVYIVGACRTPIGHFLGGLKNQSAVDLGGVVIREAAVRAGVNPGDVEEIIMGVSSPAGLGPAPAKRAAIQAGFSWSVNGFVVNQGCGSGLTAVSLAARAIRSEERHIVAAVGAESMSRAPHVLAGAREGGLFGDLILRDSLLLDGLWCAFEDVPMGQAAEVAAAKHGISRQDQDAFAHRSHLRAAKAVDRGYFRDEIVPVECPSSDGRPTLVSADEGPRRDLTPEKMAQYPAAFKKDGTVTAANASSLSDGAASLVLASDEAVKDKGLKPLARLVLTATAGWEPSLALDAPRAAVEKVVAEAGWKMAEVDLFEINEIFAVQPLLLIKALRLDGDRVNVHGGALALGDPVGAGGARILTTLLYALRHRGLRKGVAALCLAGGDGLAAAVEMV